MGGAPSSTWMRSIRCDYAMDCGADIFGDGCNGVDPNSIGGVGAYALTGIADPIGAGQALTAAGVAFTTGANLARRDDLAFTRDELAGTIIVYGRVSAAQRVLGRARIAYDGGVSLTLSVRLSR